MPRKVNQVERELLRKRILYEAKLLFAHRGYTETSLRDIASAAEIGKSTLYYYFASKDEIYLNIILKGTANHYAEIYRKVRAITDQAEFIRTMLYAFLEGAEKDPELISLLYPIGRNMPGHLLARPEVASELASYREALVTKLTGCLLPDAEDDRKNTLLQLIWTFHSGLSYKLQRSHSALGLKKEIQLFSAAINAIFGGKTC